MKDFTYSYGSKRGKKVWINAYKQEGTFGVNALIELNIVDNTSKVNWIVDRRKTDKDNFVDNLDCISNEELINNAIQFADAKGYLKGIKEKYNK